MVLQFPAAGVAGGQLPKGAFHAGAGGLGARPGRGEGWHGVHSAGRTMTIPPRPGLLAHGCAPWARLTVRALWAVARFPARAKVMGADTRYDLGRSLWD
jgi:hypothetical protein